MKKRFSFLSALVITTLCLLLLPSRAHAAVATEGPLSYVVAQGSAIIIDCDPSATGKLTIPATLDGCLVTRIEENAFEGCSKLTDITIPDSVTAADNLRFEHCTNLTSITIGNGISSIGEYAFYGCKKLSSVTLGNGVTSIGSCAFYDCTSLTSITIPDSVTSIGWGAFRNCTGLTSVKLPKGLLSIEAELFSGCTGLTDITIPDSVSFIMGMAFSDCTGLASITIPQHVSYIASYTFSSCTGLTSITLPDKLYSIDNYAFSGCINLTSITLPEKVTSIKDNAFYACFSLTSISIPRNIYRINTGAFKKCYNLTDIYFTGSQLQWDKIIIDADNDFLTNATLHCAVNCDNNHPWDNGRVTKAATCKAEGVRTYTCTACSETKTEPIPMLTAHKPGKPATATKDQVCTSCGEVLAPATGETETTPPPSDNTHSVEKDFSTVTIVIVSIATTLLCVGAVAAGIILWKKKQ